MSAVAVVARKELRSYFESPIALIFLAIFLLATLFSFFGYSSFFARNLADVRPLFAWLPLLLIFLVAAISMRQWAEERKMGTLEVLLTLPVSTRDMVFGKFLAGTLLVGVALLMTLPLPIMVSLLGDLDWGPVIGGYTGALLLGATYLSIGLCISARTDNQVVSLMLTLVIAGAMYLIGSDQLTQFFGNRGSDLLKAIGTGSRFASIERGVLDLRDLAYYGGLTGFFLALNWYFLESERIDHGAGPGRDHLRRLVSYTALVGVNALLLVVWLAPVTALRLDLTERGEYSISDVTKETLRGLGEPLRISGFFSQRTHPLLAPLVPQIRDLLAEYAIAGGDRVELDFADPNSDELLEQEIGERYQIRSVPFQVADRHQQAVVNSFFHILLRYGDQFETLSFDDLIEVRVDGDDLDVRLKNLEYDLTRTIKRVSRNFQNIESLFARLPEDTKLTLYVSPASLPDAFAEQAEHVRTVASELIEVSNGRLRFEEVDPSGDADLAVELSDRHGIRPLAVDLFGRNTFYLDVLLEANDRAQLVSPRSAMSEAEVRSALEAAVRRATPGQLKVIGLYTQTPIAPPPNPQIPPQFQPPPPQPDYRALEQIFAEDYRVEKLDLESGDVPGEIDVLIVGKPGALSDEAQFAIDQYLMRGGKLIALAGHFAIDTSTGALVAARHESPLFEMLASWGVTVEPALVMDPQNAPFPVPVEEQRGMFRVQRIEMLPYPFFPDIRQDGFAENHPVMQGLQNVTAPWSSPLQIEAPEGLEATTLLRSSSGSWLNTTGKIEPDLERYPEAGFAASGNLAARDLAVSVTGRFASTFADRPSPLFDDPGVVGDNEAIDATGRTIKESLPDARLMVLGSAEIASDLLVQLATRPGGEVHRGDLQLLQNLIDWSVEDTDLLTIRSTGAFARTLVPLSDGEIRAWEVGSYLACGVLLALGTIVPRRRGREIRPLARNAARPSGDGA